MIQISTYPRHMQRDDPCLLPVNGPAAGQHGLQGSQRAKLGHKEQAAISPLAGPEKAEDARVTQGPQLLELALEADGRLLTELQAGPQKFDGDSFGFVDAFIDLPTSLVENLGEWGGGNEKSALNYMY